ncbi:hypothetical protein [Bythopirellula polymerisocia]|uniref:Carboxypeptidase regulatory-like domain-containing protein n=1 Tax=Bythopirellula polymerisocia TaxID=2528003 RepID=A0A5C6CJK5_9BACT|nr:hypothetical protein [Bythopirellula polymerisocia]TWU23664.1 hypothetical protein Pla144_38390 [Bythopirellula polymerisocia]
MWRCEVRAFPLWWIGLLAVVVGISAGCDQGPLVVPVEGTVYYNDKPLPFGSVMFQPQMGQPAGARIAEDGTFKLSTFSEYDGAIVGQHKVKVSCYASQSPELAKKKTVGEQTLGPSLIPENYTYSDQSGLTADINSEGNEPIELRLTGPPIKVPR